MKSKLSIEQQEMYDKYCMRVNSDISIDSVILSDENRVKLDEFILETKNGEKFIQAGLKPINRILMYGASGTGKTYLSKALSNFLSYQLFYVDISRALSTGIASQALTEIFNVADRIGQAVIFLDECDAICWARDDDKNQDTADIRRANNTLFQLLDQMNPRCIFISATNLYRNLDAAFVNRFNIQMEFDRPSAEDVDKSIRKFMRGSFSMECDMVRDVKDAVLSQVQYTQSLSYRKIRDWVERAEKQAVIKDACTVKESEIYGYLMQELRIRTCYDKNGELYLHQYAKGRYS
jgi:Predicted ATPase (AAA+ superfamily)